MTQTIGFVIIAVCMLGAFAYVIGLRPADQHDGRTEQP